MRANAPGDAVQAAQQFARGGIKRHLHNPLSRCLQWFCLHSPVTVAPLRCNIHLHTVDNKCELHQFRQQESDLAPSAFISKFNAQFRNPLASWTASDCMQREIIVKLKKLYALHVGKRVRDKNFRHIHRRGPSKLRSNSSLPVEHTNEI